MLVQKLRLQRGWSQQQLAELCGLSTRTIQRIENGQPASVETLKSLAAVFEVNFATLQPETTMTDTETTPRVDREPAAAAPAAPSPAAPASAPPAEQARAGVPPSLPADEALALREVRTLRAFYAHAVRYLVVVAVLLVVNYATTPSRHWAVWVALGWGVAVLIHASRTFRWLPFQRADWERRQVEKRLGRPL